MVVTGQYKPIKEYCNEIRHDCNNSNSKYYLLSSFLALDATESRLLIEVLKDLQIHIYILCQLMTNMLD
jgi:hypothetical protein